jgi:hypothetical protein
MGSRPEILGKCSFITRQKGSYVPFFMGPSSSLGSIVSMRPFLLEIGFLKERQEFKERVVALQAVKH